MSYVPYCRKSYIICVPKIYYKFYRPIINIPCIENSIISNYTLIWPYIRFLGTFWCITRLSVSFHLRPSYDQIMYSKHESFIFFNEICCWCCCVYPHVFQNLELILYSLQYLLIRRLLFFLIITFLSGEHRFYK